VPHYDGHGATGASIGVETLTTNATTTYTLHVGRVLTRDIGAGEHRCTLQLRAHHYTGTSPSAGVMTYNAGESYAPILTAGTSERAKMAMRASGVTDALAAIGGTGYAGSGYLVGWQSVIDTAAVTRLVTFIRQYNSHIETWRMSVHDTSLDDYSTSAVATTAVANLAAARTRINDWIVAYGKHRAKTAGRVSGEIHNVADTLNTAPASLTGTESTAATITKFGSCATVFNSHISQVWLSASSAWLDFVHRAPGGSVDEVQTTPLFPDESSLCTSVRTLCQKLMIHRSRWQNDAVTSTYHAATTAATNGYFQPYDITLASYRVGLDALADTVNELLGRFQSHVTNKDHGTGASAATHTIPDWRARTDAIPRASTGDLASVMNAFELLEHKFQLHITSTGGVHSTTGNNGAWRTTYTGVQTISTEFHDALNSATAATPPNENEAAARLVQLGGFVKV
jgi:hypothetical protein